MVNAKPSNPSAAAMRRALDLIVSKAGTLKTRIDDVQCTAIDARLSLMDDDARPDQERSQHIAHELSSVVDDIEALLVALQSVSTEAERGRLQ